MADITQIVADNNTAVTNKTAEGSITPTIMGARLNVITQNLRPYKVYSAILTQQGTDAPQEVTILENTLGECVTMSFVRNDVGDYDMIALLNGEPDPNGAFTIGKTFCFYGNTTSPGWYMSFFPNPADGNRINLETFQLFPDPSGSYYDVSDNLLFKCPVEVRVYPSDPEEEV